MRNYHSKLKAHSIRKTEAKRATQFKKGHTGFNYKKCNESIPDNTLEESTHERRLNVTEAEDVMHLSQTEGTLPYRLRPQPENNNSNGENSDIHENIIVSVEKLQELLQSVHNCQLPAVKIKIVKRQGLHVIISGTCNYCKWSSPNFGMSDTIQKSRGPPSGALNEMALLPVMKSKAGIEDVRLILTCLNIKPPSYSCMQEKLNRMSDTAASLNESTMIDNQRHIKTVNELAGKDGVVDVQFDVSFSRRPRGGFEAAQQSFGVAIDHSTTRPLPIAAAIANKHCRKSHCDHTSMSCTKTYRYESSIASSERALLHQSLDSICSSGLVKVQSLTTDASAQVAKAVRDYKSEKAMEFVHYKCFIHRLRTLEKNIRTLKLSSIPAHYSKSIYMVKLGSCIRSRVRLELQNLKRLKLKGQSFVHRGFSAMKYVTPCLSGHHRFCRDNSTVCTNHLQTYNTKSLPYGVHLQLNNTDLNNVQAEINKVFSVEGLQNLGMLYNTNMCESMHASVYNLAPKSTCWSRNFTGLCHSATHSRSVGVGEATVQLAKASGVKVTRKCRMFIQLHQYEKVRKYHSLRKKLKKYKSSRYFFRKRATSRIQFQNSLYSNNPTTSSVSAEHNYGLSN